MKQGRGPSRTAPTAPPPSEVALERMNQALAHQRAGEFDQAADIYRSLLRHDPAWLEPALLLAWIDIERGRLEAAAAGLRSVIARRPAWPEALSSLAYVHEELGMWREAVVAYRQSLAARPERTGDRFRLADALKVLGRIDEALKLYRDLAASPGTRPQALAAIAALKGAGLSDGELDELSEVAARADAPPGLLFSLGEALEGRGRIDEAFAVFAAANALRRQALIDQIEPKEREMAAPEALTRNLPPADVAKAHIEAVGYVKTMFTRDFIAHHQGRGHHLAAPIFIVGMPRSGSTLIEQILSSHRKVQGLGESPALPQTIAGRYPMDLFAPEPPGHFRILADAYLAAMHARGWKSAPRFVDKMLYNYMNIGMIHLMFPRAVILHAVRDPVDVCLANFRQPFATGNEESYDLGDIGQLYVRYRQMMDHWARVLPGRVVDVSHEALVADPEAMIRWLVTDACGLAWDDACLRFHETKRPVRTASVAQVRQPIFTTSLQRWRRYEKHLGPLFEALGPYAPET